jgi:hypothetical protein
MFYARGPCCTAWQGRLVVKVGCSSRLKGGFPEPVFAGGFWAAHKEDQMSPGNIAPEASFIFGKEVLIG